MVWTFRIYMVFIVLNHSKCSVFILKHSHFTINKEGPNNGSTWPIHHKNAVCWSAITLPHFRQNHILAIKGLFQNTQICFNLFFNNTLKLRLIYRVTIYLPVNMNGECSFNRRISQIIPMLATYTTCVYYLHISCHLKCGSKPTYCYNKPFFLWSCYLFLSSKQYDKQWNNNMKKANKRQFQHITQSKATKQVRLWMQRKPFIQ